MPNYDYVDPDKNRLLALRYDDKVAVHAQSGAAYLDETERVKLARFLLEGTGFMAVMTPAKASEELAAREQALREANVSKALPNYGQSGGAL